MDGEMLLRWLGMLAAALHERRDALNALDAAIGDGDHGTTMDRGFAAVAARVPEWRAGVQEGTLDAIGALDRAREGADFFEEVVRTDRFLLCLLKSGRGSMQQHTTQRNG